MVVKRFLVLQYTPEYAVLKAVVYSKMLRQFAILDAALKQRIYFAIPSLLSGVKPM